MMSLGSGLLVYSLGLLVTSRWSMIEGVQFMVSRSGLRVGE